MDNWKQYFRPRLDLPVCEDSYRTNKLMIEGFCSFQSGSRGTMAIQRMRNMIPADRRIFVVAKTVKQSADFGKVLGRTVYTVINADNLRGADGSTIVLLGDWHDRKDSREIVEYLPTRRNVDKWRIREWRFSDD